MLLTFVSFTRSLWFFFKLLYLQYFPESILSVLLRCVDFLTQCMGQRYFVFALQIIVFIYNMWGGIIIVLISFHKLYYIRFIFLLFLWNSENYWYTFIFLWTYDSLPLIRALSLKTTPHIKPDSTSAETVKYYLIIPHQEKPLLL